VRKKNKKRVAKRRRGNRRGNPGAEELVILGLSNPHRGARGRKRNSSGDAAALYKTFHGRDPKEILEIQQSAAIRQDYTALGDLDYVVFLPDGEKEARKIEFTDRDKVKLASNPEGTQLYFIGGNQNLAQCLDEFPGDHSKDFIDLGETMRVSYLARKSFDGFNPVYYYHDLGEDGGARPRAFYNKLQKVIFLVGGDYKVEAPGIVN
jgi:hypothetical protein